MQWDPETTGWEPGPPFISPSACRAWPWLLRIPGPEREAGGTVRASQAQPLQRPGVDRGDHPRPCVLLTGPSCWREAAAQSPWWSEPTPARLPELLTHGPQVGPGRRAVGGRLAHQLVDGGQLVDGPMHFVHGREDGPIGRRLQVASARKGQLGLVRSSGHCHLHLTPPCCWGPETSTRVRCQSACLLTQTPCLMSDGGLLAGRTRQGWEGVGVAYIPGIGT